jgi:SpoVK/Ycf46/Vps4 family AAA+-type ATPase
MMAKEMSDSSNRGKIVWILASSRPDLIEVDLKRPGRVDVKIPIFPTTTPEEGFQLIRALCKRRGMVLEPGDLEVLRARIPDWLTPRAAEALAVKVYRMVKTKQLTPQAALAEALETYQPAVSRETMEFQVGLAVSEASDLSFVPESLRHFGNAEG